MKKNNNQTTLCWILQVADRRKIYIVLLLFVQGILGASSIAYAVIFRGLIDAAVAKEQQIFWNWIFLLAMLVIFQVACSALNRFLQEYSRASLENCFKERLLSHLLERDYGQVTHIHSGEWMNRLTSDTVVVADGLTQILPGAAGMAVRLTGAVCALIFLYPALGYILIPGGIILIFTSYGFRKMMKSLHRKVQETDGSLRVFLQESLTGMLVVRAFARENMILESARERMEKHKDMRMRKNRVSNFCNIGFGLIMNGAYVVGATVGGDGILTGTMTYGTLMAIVQLIGQIQSPFANITGYLPKYYSMLASAERLKDAENFGREDGEQYLLCEIQKFYQKELQCICLREVDFNYFSLDEAGKDKMVVLKHLNLEIPRGAYIAFTGPSGCGKSTLLKLLMCLYQPVRGERLIRTGDGREILLTARWRRLFAYVPQGNQLMSGTIRQIIVFGERERINDEDKIWNALRMAGAEEFVRELPYKLDTFLGEKGAGLSEGQMQRIAIARAIFSENPILILDESTSALDEETEKIVLSNLRSMTDKTVLVVTHRRAVLEICDMEFHFGVKGVSVRKINHSEPTEKQ